MELNENLIERFIGYVIAQLEGFTAKELVILIKNNYIPPVYQLEIPPLLAGIKKIILNNREEIIKKITYETVLEYGPQFRPDLLAVIKHPKGKEWMERFLKVVKFTVEHIELTPLERTELLKNKIIKPKTELEQEVQDPIENVEMLKEESSEKVIDKENPYHDFEHFISDI